MWSMAELNTEQIKRDEDINILSKSHKAEGKHK